MGVNDLLALLGKWGEEGSPCDLDCDGIVAVGDLLVLIAKWGTCP